MYHTDNFGNVLFHMLNLITNIYNFKVNCKNISVIAMTILAKC